ncbi:hypothetical protein HaloA020_22890 [Halomonas sp. A020]|nr:hypothetical protein HaloA020_22890 [Halomonas sp. A020]
MNMPRAINIVSYPVNKLIKKFFHGRNIRSERFRIRKRLKKGDSEGLFWFKLGIYFYIQYFFSFLLIALCVGVLDSFEGVNDDVLFEAIREVPVRDFLYIAMGVIAISLVRETNKVPLALLITHSAFLVVFMQIMNWIPDDMATYRDSYLINWIALFSFVSVLVFMICIPMNAMFVLVTRIATLDLAKKNDSAQPSPAPSDLAHDLRYSRSRARRSRAQR